MSEQDTIPTLRATYDDWAATYDDDVRDWGYVTPGRIPMALRRAGANTEKLVLDVGCGTGLCGMALRAAGFGHIDGTDLSPAMLAEAEKKGVYRALWPADGTSLGHVERGDYPILVACGVIGLGEAPPELLGRLVAALSPGGLLAVSLDAPSLADGAFTDRLDAVAALPDIEIVFEEDGPDLPAQGVTAMVFVLKRL